MLETRMPAGLALIGELKQKGYPLAYVGDVVGTGSPQPWGMAAGSNRDGAVKSKQ
jgi:aconitase B